MGSLLELYMIVRSILKRYKVIDIIGKTLENEGYINARVSSKRSVDLSLTPINLVALGFTKENIQYKISIEIMDSK